MLILTRKVGEVIVIGTKPNQIEVTIFEVDRGRVRLGFEADRSIPIMRSELIGEAKYNQEG